MKTQRGFWEEKQNIACNYLQGSIFIYLIVCFPYKISFVFMVEKEIKKTKTTLHLESILLGRFLLREETSKNNVSKPRLLFFILIHLIPTVNLQGNSHLIEGIQRSLSSDLMQTVDQRQRCHQRTPFLTSKI